MLDPLTALSLAGNVVQFVQFGCSLISQVRDVHGSSAGVSEEVQDMDAVVTRLLGTVHGLDEHIKSVAQEHKQGRSSDLSKRLLEIANICKHTAADILRQLEAFKVREPPSVWRSVRQALKLMWKTEELDALMKRFNGYMSELDTAILISMKQNIDLVSFRTSQNFYKLDQAAQRIVDLLLLNRSVFKSALDEHTHDIKGAIVSEQVQTRAMILELVQGREVGPAALSSSAQSNGPREPSVSKEEKEKARVRNCVLNSLGFPTMHDRQDEVAEAFPSTFDWIFDEPTQHVQNLPWSDFVKWLQTGKGLYWVNGKAGSGKSTLMKYMTRHKETSELLSQWSQSTPLLVATFFFWNSGSPDQRSQVGLLRSLLFQIMQYRSELIPQIFPEEYAKVQTHVAHHPKTYPKLTWSRTRLQMGIHRLVNLDNLPFKLCLFVDGLDEFEGDEDRNDYRHMIELFRSLTSSSSIKACLSSRPLLIFEESFKNDPGLRLQDLTSGDIRRYVVEKLSVDPGMRSIADNDPWQKHDFVKEICAKAQGVFLWVQLVVRSLIDGLGNSDTMTDLRARLDMLPTDLEDLYRHMMRNIDKIYLAKTSKIFQMVRMSRRMQSKRMNSDQRTTPITVLLLALAIEDRPEVNVYTVSEAWITRNLSVLCDVMRRRLQTWCAGLLEVPEFVWNRIDALDIHASVRTKVTWEVAFLHRTVRDFIESEQVWNALLMETANSNFDPCLALLESTVLLYQLAGRLVSNPLGNGLYKHELLEPATYAFLFAQNVDIAKQDACIETLEELDKVMGRHLQLWTGRYVGHWTQYLDLSLPSDNIRSFLDIAVFYGLDRYVLNKLHRLQAQDQENHRLVRDHIREPAAESARPKRTITLLDMAVSPDSPSPATAQVLLGFGANPNEKSGDPSRPLWEQILSRAQISIALRKDTGKWLQIISIFVQYDVDLVGPGQNRQSAYDHLSSLLGLFESAHPAEVTLLQPIIDKKLQSKRDKLKIWAGGKPGSRRTSPHPIWSTV